MTGPPEPHFNMCTTSQGSGLERHVTQSPIGVERVAFLAQKC